MFWERGTVALDPSWIDAAKLAIDGLRMELDCAATELERLAHVLREHELGAEAGRALQAAQRAQTASGRER